MSDTTDSQSVVPVWTLATEDSTELPALSGLFNADELTTERLTELRAVLAALSTAPTATLELHRIERRRDPTSGIALSAGSPLAQQLTALVASTSQKAPATAELAASGETLYRMVIPAKVASQVSKGLVQPMKASGTGGIYSALRGSTGITAHAKFVPVSSAGATTGSVATAGAGVAGAGAAMTVAAPLVMMAVAVGASAYADQQRAKSIEKITDLLEQLQDDNLDQERNGLDACKDAIDSATAILLDEGNIGQSLGLDSAAHQINTALSSSRRRLKTLTEKLDSLKGGTVELDSVNELFPGLIDSKGITFAHLEIAGLAIALKRRILVLQAVEHAQLNSSENPFKSFLHKLRNDEQRLDALEDGFRQLLIGISELELKPAGGRLKRLHYSPSEVQRLLDASYRVRELGTGVGQSAPPTDMIIDIERGPDGAITVFPA